MAKAIPATTMLITKIRSRAPFSCSWPLARRTIFHRRSSRMAIASVARIVVSIPANATRIAIPIEFVSW